MARDDPAGRPLQIAVTPIAERLRRDLPTAPPIRRGAKTGELVPNRPRPRPPAGILPRHVTVSPDGRSAYAINWISSRRLPVRRRSQAGRFFRSRWRRFQPARCRGGWRSPPTARASTSAGAPAQTTSSQYDVGPGGALTPEGTPQRCRRGTPTGDRRKPRRQEPLRRQLRDRERHGLPIRRRRGRSADAEVAARGRDGRRPNRGRGQPRR